MASNTMVTWLLVATTLATGSAQFLQRQDGGEPVYKSSWFMGSMSWTSASDGQVHQELHTRQSRTVGDSSGFVTSSRTEMGCIDGHCQRQTIQTVRPPSVETDGLRAPGDSRVPLRLQRLLNNILPPKVVITQEGGPVVAPPVVIAFRGARDTAPTKIAAVVPAREQQPDDLGFSEALLFPMLGGLCFMCAATSVGKALKYFYSRSSDARERPLAEPLAPVEEDSVAVPPPAPKAPADADARAAAQSFLSSLYQKESSKAMAKYLVRVYTRALQ